ncbi:hypothetical protein NDU88_002726 [Pleurodeles waltl]|uniref:Uncharacterized protein n=1 Tax=Pleurodeles waltl TaxID=8319 RepID=A0AAV7VFE2_PLEWA|nr:hypothetical protein NDU88_002726 [Pleurodeles waltl]
MPWADSGDSGRPRRPHCFPLQKTLIPTGLANSWGKSPLDIAPAAEGGLPWSGLSVAINSGRRRKTESNSTHLTAQQGDDGLGVRLPLLDPVSSFFSRGFQVEFQRSSRGKEEKRRPLEGNEGLDYSVANREKPYFILGRYA